MNFSPDDLRQLAELEISKDKVLHQIESFKKGFPFAVLDRPCAIGDGLVRLDELLHGPLLEFFEQASSLGRIMKFVPASGAATRMFHSLLFVYNHYEEHREALLRKQSDHPDLQACLEFIHEIKKFPFYEDIRDAADLIRSKMYDRLLQRVLTEEGLNYASLPKALVTFHRYSDHARTALEEHLAEALGYAKDGQNLSRIHLTVSSEHRKTFESLIGTVRSRYENKAARLEIGYSEQKRSTDTIAVNMQNEPIRDTDGRLVFRPAGHGALLENLNEINADIVVLKNIDNVVPDRLKPETYLYKKLLIGYLVQLQKHTFYYLQRISQNDLHDADVSEAVYFAQSQLHITFQPGFDGLRNDEKVKVLFDKLDRPIRVCGMVKNQGEPGGGPFWVKGKDGTASLQIVEKSQINTNSAGQKQILESSTHFNPVDLVCGLRDYKGVNFDLHRFADSETGFISTKSINGKLIKAMELPGLWNGSMAHWNTVFVEVPLTTFNPVKTVNDLLRPEHQ